MNHWFLLSGGKFDPEKDLVLTSEVPPSNDIVLSSTEAGTNAVFAGEIIFPNPISAGVLWEVGGAGQGSKISIEADGRLFIRAGDGGSNDGTPDAGKAEAILSAAEVSLLAGNQVTAVWEIIINPGRVRLWLDGELTLEHEITSALESSRYSGGDNGGWGIVQSSLAGTTGTTLSWQGSLSSSLRIYLNQSVGA